MLDAFHIIFTGMNGVMGADIPAGPPDLSSAGEDKSSRLAWIDALRASACFGVVALHIWGPATYAYFWLPLSSWWAANAAITLIAWCIPVFVMISGAVNLAGRHHENAGRFFSRRARLLWLTLSWSVFFVVLRLITEPEFEWRHAVASLKYGLPYYHMWFLFMILGLYLSTPLLCRFVRSVSRGWRIAAALGLILVSAVWSLLNDSNYLHSPLTFYTMFLPFVGYYLIGYELAGIRVERRTAFRLLPVILVSMGFLMYLAFLVAKRTITGVTLAWLHGSFSPLIVVISIALFQFFHAAGGVSAGNGLMQSRIDRLVAAVAKLSPLTLGIYIVHPLFIRMLTHIGLIDLDKWGICGQVLGMLVVFGWSAVTVFALKSIPYVRALVISSR